VVRRVEALFRAICAHFDAVVAIAEAREEQNRVGYDCELQAYVVIHFWPRYPSTSFDTDIHCLHKKMPRKGKGAAWSRQKVQQAVDALSGAASDLTHQAGKITELVEYLKEGVPTPAAIGDLLQQTPVLSVLLSVVTARMQQQDVRKQELLLFWKVCIGLTQCIGGHVAMSMLQPGLFDSQPSLERQIVTAGGSAASTFPPPAHSVL
jgi:hypothetical protein